jgi:hypothetical protein
MLFFPRIINQDKKLIAMAQGKSFEEIRVIFLPPKYDKDIFITEIKSDNKMRNSK